VRQHLGQLAEQQQVLVVAAARQQQGVLVRQQAWTSRRLPQVLTLLKC
jgi:hypothetical protein